MVISYNHDVKKTTKTDKIERHTGQIKCQS